MRPRARSRTTVSSCDWGGIGVLDRRVRRRARSEARAAAEEIEALGFDTLWDREGLVHVSVANGAVLLAATDRIRVASGIGNIWGV